MNRKAWKIFGLSCTVFVVFVWAANLRDEFRHLQTASSTGRLLKFTNATKSAAIADKPLAVEPVPETAVPVEAAVSSQEAQPPFKITEVKAGDENSQGQAELIESLPKAEQEEAPQAPPVAEREPEAREAADEAQAPGAIQVEPQAVPIEPPVKRGIELKGPQAALSAPRLAEIEKIKQFMEQQHHLQEIAQAEAPMKKALLEQFNSFRRDVERRDLEAAENTKQEQLRFMKAYAERLERDRLAREASTKASEKAPQLPEKEELSPVEVAQAQSTLHSLRDSAESDPPQKDQRAETEDAVVHGHIAVTPVADEQADQRADAIVVRGHIATEEQLPPPRAVVVVHGHVAEVTIEPSAPHESAEERQEAAQSEDDAAT